jgi:hypothetical protein
MVENFPTNMQFFFKVQKHVPAMSVPVPVYICILIPVPIWYVQNLRPVQQCNPPTIKGWSYHTISCMFFRSHGGKLGGLCLALHGSNICLCDGSYVTEVSVCTFVVQGPSLSPCQIPPSSSLILVEAAQTPCGA